MSAQVSPAREAPARLSEVRQVFEETLAHADRDRSAFLDRRCAHDAALRRDVASLLDSDARVRATNFIEEVIEAAVQELRARNRAKATHGLVW